MRGPDERSDEELAEQVRRGDDDAFGVLWERHVAAGRAAARQFSRLADPDDLVSEAYLSIFRALRGGGGPREAFRTYLYRSIRNLAYTRGRTAAPVSLELVGDLEDESLDVERATMENTITVRAFRTLPTRWQTVLWYTQVEGLQPADVAPFFGMTANGVAALAHRAREGLRKAWLQAHVNDLRVPEACRWTTDRMGDYVRGDLTPRARLRFDQHLDGCTRCSILLEEIDDLGRRLAVVLLPTVLGGAAGAALLAELTSGDAAVATASATPAIPPLHIRPPARLLAAGAAAASVVIVAGAIGLSGLLAPAPTAGPATAQEETEEPEPTPDPDPTPTVVPEPEPTGSPGDLPEESGPPRAGGEPPTPPVRPPDVTAPGRVVLTQPVDRAFINVAQPLFSGTGEPGALVELRIGGADDDPITTRVLGDGSWQVQSAALPDGTHVAHLTQTDAAGNRSQSVRVTVRIDTVAEPPTLATPSGPQITLPAITGSAEPGARVALLGADGATLGSALADDSGAWTVDLPDPAAASVTIAAVQADLAGNISAASPPAEVELARPEMLLPAPGDVVPSTGGATVVTVSFDGIVGQHVEVLVDGVPTGNLHLLTGGPLVRSTVPLPDGEHVIAVRYRDADSGAVGATIAVRFQIAP